MPRGPAHQSAGSALFLRSTLNHPIDTLASFSPHLAQLGFGFLRLVRQSRVTSTRDDKVLAQPCLAPRCTLHAARPESGSDWNWRTRNSQVQYEEPLLLGLIFDSNRRGLFPTLSPLLATPYPSSHLTLAYRHSPCLNSMSRPLPQPPLPFYSSNYFCYESSTEYKHRFSDRVLSPPLLYSMDQMLQHFPPGILTYPDPSEFDYSTFLQQTEDIPFPDPSHSTSAGTISESSPGQATPPSSDGQSTSAVVDMSVKRRQSAQKQRLERRGHTKSRRGCYNCKRRRIKVSITSLLLARANP